MTDFNDPSQNNAMSEIALALAMAFFSIMVLTMVSMGAGKTSSAQSHATSDDGVQIMASSNNSNDTEKSISAKPERLLIHFGGEYLDSQLRPVDPKKIYGKGNWFLAISPNATMTEAVSARGDVPIKDVTVITLDEKWMKALELQAQ